MIQAGIYVYYKLAVALAMIILSNILGDSGGPLYDASQRILVGVVSGGPSDCKGKPIRYSRVAAGVSFIKTLTFC